MQNSAALVFFYFGDDAPGDQKRRALIGQFLRNRFGNIRVTLQFFNAIGNVFFEVAEIDKRLFRRLLMDGFWDRKNGGFYADSHDGFQVVNLQNIPVRDPSGKVSRPPHNGSPQNACDISAKAFVTITQQRAEASSNKEACFGLLRFHAPKFCLGETHVPLRFSSKKQKTLPVVGQIGYARY
jgi:hypothetical protein